MAGAEDDCIRVAIRIRPLVSSELEKGCQSAVKKTAGVPQVFVNKTDAFTFNYVFDSQDSQELVYKEAVYQLVDKLFKGFNVTILAYGQTGSGKTFTMGTAFDGNFDYNVGVIPRVMDDIFKRIDENSNEAEYSVTCSFMELYQEQLYDLLSTASRDQTVIDMREDRGRIIMPGLSEVKVSSARETTNCLLMGSSGRAVASTAMNQQSSRSHAIFTITIQAATTNSSQKTVTTSKFHLVDLAGSERTKKTKATGDRFKEGVKINQGLLALGNVISALGTNQGSGGYVSYRDSKLTRLLQDSLGGNSVTLMIACISPADYNIAETLSTLRYADRARKIKNKPVVNEDPHAAEINHLKAVIQKLRIELLNQSCGVASSIAAMDEFQRSSKSNNLPNGGNAVGDVLGKSYHDLMEKYRNLQQQLQTTLHDVAENEMRAHIVEASHEKIKSKTDEIKLIVDGLMNDFASDSNNDALKEHTKRISDIRLLINDLDKELQNTQTEIFDNKKHCSIVSSMDRSDSDDENAVNSNDIKELMQEQTDEFTSKQMNFNEQLRRINRELTLKEELHERVAGNLNKFCTLENTVVDEKKYQECEKQIHALEMEKAELLDKLKHVKENASAKLAEERRKRVQALEEEIANIKRKNMQQAKLLKVREKETAKIKNMQSDIQAMKESKVKLIRAMRAESENFRQWKLTREKELIQLRSKDRKMQNEMKRKEALHNKQNNVLKRKCESAMAVNKRLKDAIDRQRVAQSQRNKQPAAKDAATKIDQAIAWVDRELEVIISVIDAENSLEQLMEDRGIISARLADAKQCDMIESASLAALEEELEMRNAQITDLQQKVVVTDIETRITAMCESIQNMPEARAVLKHLLSTISEIRRDYAAKTQELKIAHEAAEEKLMSAEKRVRLMEINHEEEMAQSENTYEEKISVLLRELHNAPQIAVGTATPEQVERLRIQEEQLNKMDSLREELESYKRLCNELQEVVEMQGKKEKEKKLPQLRQIEIDEAELTDAESTDCDDDSLYDPDWKKTPRFRKTNRSSGNSRKNASSSSIDMDEATTSAAAIRSNIVPAITKGVGIKRKSDDSGFRCGCRGDCSNKRCGCRHNNESCSKNCKCSESCQNGKHLTANDDSGDDDDDEEQEEKNHNVENEKTDNISDTAFGSTINETITLSKPNDLSYLTPKAARFSEISFNVPSARKKFFN